MKISKKCQYALRAIFELTAHNTHEPVKIHDIAAAQGISPRFLEVILNELKHGGFVESRRGSEGGYLLARPAENLTIEEIIEYIQGPISLAPDVGLRKRNASFFGDQAFGELWRAVDIAVSRVCNDKTFAELVEFERNRRQGSVPNYSI